MPRFDLFVRGRLHRRCSKKYRYSRESGSCMALPAGCRRSRVCCSLDSRRSIDSSGDENIRSSGGVGAGLTASTSRNVVVSNPGKGSDDSTEIFIVDSPAGLWYAGGGYSIDSAVL